MTLAAAVAKTTGEDISQMLLEKAEVEDNPIRHGLLQLMSDKRFLSTVSPVMSWQKDAAEALEEFANSLEREYRAGRLSEESAKALMEEFFAVWSKQMKKKSPLYEASRKARKKARMEGVGKDGNASEPSGEGNFASWGARIDKVLSAFLESEKNENMETDEGMGIGSGDPKMEQQRKENVFLNQIPKTLKRLAMLIGRAGENDISAKGHFLTASKSDIEGITVGNNLSALLPSEVALLSDPTTQDIFYRNYAEKRLQVFASASQSAQPDMHKDGPVIICVDESSSMSGDPLQTAITMAYAVTIVAKRRHRQVLIVAYSDSHKMMRVDSLGRQRRQLLNFLSSISMGGNDENSMFEWLFQEILPREEKFKTADILCISDFGWVSIDTFVKGMIDEQKAAGMRFYGLNIGGVFGGWDGIEDETWAGDGPMSVCDSLWEYRNSQCVEVNNLSTSVDLRNRKR